MMETYVYIRLSGKVECFKASDVVAHAVYDSVDHAPEWLREKMAVLDTLEDKVEIPGVGNIYRYTGKVQYEHSNHYDPHMTFYRILT